MPAIHPAPACADCGAPSGAVCDEDCPSGTAAYAEWTALELDAFEDEARRDHLERRWVA
jgi:hypothetical protein